MMRVLLLAAAAMATYEECHLYRSAVIARERAPAPSRRRLLDGVEVDATIQRERAVKF